MKQKTRGLTFTSLILEQKYLFLLALVLIFISEGAIHVFQIVKGRLVELAVAGSTSVLGQEVAKFMALVLIIPVTFYLYSKVYLRISAYCLRRLRQAIFDSILKRPYAQFIRHSEGRYLNAYTSQINILESSYFQGIFGFLQIVGTSIPGLFLIYAIYPPLLVVSLIGMALAVTLPELLKKRIVRLEKQAIKADESNLSLFNEILNGLETIVNFAKEKLFISRFRRSTAVYTQNRKKWHRSMAASFHIAQLLLNVYSIVALLFVATVVSDGTLGIGDYIAVLGILFNFTDNLPYTSNYLQRFKAARENLNYINETIAYEDVPPVQDAVNLKRVEDISFDKISFTYPDSDKPILEDFSLKIGERGITQIQGESGRGKSTLLSLLCGYYPVDDGEIYLSGIALEKVDNLNDLVTIMRQYSIFFDGSLADNLSMYRPVRDEELMNGLRRLGLDHLATQEVLHAPIGQYSGGEARRLMVLRALLRGSEIIILDEPLANLDTESIQLLEKVLAEEEDHFLILITHQPVSIPTRFSVSI
ncbi:MAG TPA: ABC transporter ATP-binding protein [Clostridiaceae bacterium]|nr:ABC transporter ATP-binding protein [Clostridiaceae bacterium]